MLCLKSENYERGLEDLKLVCDAYIENLSNCKQEKIGKYVERNKKKNQDVIFSKCDVKGFNNEGQFIEPMRLFQEIYQHSRLFQR